MGAKTYAHPSNARRAARKALGLHAKEGEHYVLEFVTDGTVGFKPIKRKGERRRRKAPAKKPAGRGRGRKSPAGGNGNMTDALVAYLTDPARDGATAAEVAEHFGWEEHTARARISTGPRSKGYKAVRSREEGRGSVYRLERQLPLGEARGALGNRYSGKKAGKGKRIGSARTKPYV